MTLKINSPELQRVESVRTLSELRSSPANIAEFEGHIYKRQMNNDLFLGPQVGGFIATSAVVQFSEVPYDSVVGPFARLNMVKMGSGVTIGEGVRLGHVGKGYVHGADIIIDHNATVGAYSILSPCSMVGYNSVIGRYVRMHSCVGVEEGTQIGDCVVIGKSAEIQEGAKLGNGSIVKKGAKVKAGANLPDESVIETPIKVALSELVRSYPFERHYSELDESKFTEAVHSLIRNELERNGNTAFRGYHFDTLEERTAFIERTMGGALVSSYDAKNAGYHTPGKNRRGYTCPVFKFLSFSASEDAAEYFARMGYGYGAIVKIKLDNLDWDLISYGSNVNTIEEIQYAWLAEVRINQNFVPSSSIIDIISIRE